MFSFNGIHWLAAENSESRICEVHAAILEVIAIDRITESVILAGRDNRVIAFQVQPGAATRVHFGFSGGSDPITLCANTQGATKPGPKIAVRNESVSAREYTARREAGDYQRRTLYRDERDRKCLEISFASGCTFAGAVFVITTTIKSLSG